MKFLKICPVILLVFFFLCFSSPSFAESGPLEKIGRGVANVAFGPLELVQQPLDVAQDKGNIAALTYGVFKGVAMTVAREVVGVIDIITFLMPLPGCTDDPEDIGWGYGPMLRPAWVIDREHNAFNFFYDDNSMCEKF
ncbi:MAG: exosortase system-associated protein, TIGR04073 family [Victivallaceae bacterium]|nr:exosortase system-associated protein, TIGR04073 family [Victivallaceae bacterium]